MSKTLNLIIVDDMALVKSLTERLGFSKAPWDLTNLLWGSQEGLTSTLLRETRYCEEDIGPDLLFYIVVSTAAIEAVKGIGAYHHIGAAFKAVNLPPNLDVEFDRIMLATGYERFVVKERHSHFEGWHKHQNESRAVPLPEGGRVMVNDEDPNTDPRFRFPPSKIAERMVSEKVMLEGGSLLDPEIQVLFIDRK